MKHAFTDYEGLKTIASFGETPTLMFVPDEKCWLIGIVDVENDVALLVCTDPEAEPDKFSTIEEALEQIEHICETPVMITPKKTQ